MVINYIYIYSIFVIVCTCENGHEAVEAHDERAWLLSTARTETARAVYPCAGRLVGFGVHIHDGT
jgi:hypothetical protein